MIKCPGCLLIFEPSRWALFQGWALIEFSNSNLIYFQLQQIMKMFQRRILTVCWKFKILRKLGLQESLLVYANHYFFWWVVVGAGRLLTISGNRVGSYLRGWGWGLNQINNYGRFFHKPQHFLCAINDLLSSALFLIYGFDNDPPSWLVFSLACSDVDYNDNDDDDSLSYFDIMIFSF